MATQRPRSEIVAEVAAAEGEIACVIAAVLLEVALDCRDLLTDIKKNTEPSP